MNFAGLPPTMVFGATSLVTTAPVATTAFLPTVTPGRMVAPAPIQAFSQMWTGLQTRIWRSWRSWLWRCIALGARLPHVLQRRSFWGRLFVLASYLVLNYSAKVRRLPEADFTRIAGRVSNYAGNYLCLYSLGVFPCSFFVYVEKAAGELNAIRSAISDRVFELSSNKATNS